MKRSSAVGVLFGIFIIAFGLLELGKGILSWNISFFVNNWLPLLIVAAAILSIVHHGFKFWNIVILVFGGCILIGRISFLGRRISFFALIIVVLGIWIIVHAVSHKHFNLNKVGGYASKDSNDFPEYESVFSEHFVTNTSKSFKGAHISSVFGHMIVDLTEIDIQGIVVLDCSGVFGTLEIKMPRNLRYRTSVTPVFGSFINKAPLNQPVTGFPYIEVKGAAVFGTIEIV